MTIVNITLGILATIVLGKWTLRHAVVGWKQYMRYRDAKESAILANRELVHCMANWSAQHEINRMLSRQQAVSQENYDRANFWVERTNCARRDENEQNNLKKRYLKRVITRVICTLLMGCGFEMAVEFTFREIISLFI